MTKKVVTMGELLMRLSTPGYQRFTQAQSFDVVYGGAEANVAVSLSNYGLNSYFVTQLPDNPIGQSADNYLKKYGVNTDYVVKAGDRVGIYFFEKGTSVRPSKVVYDRANSAITKADIEKFDFDEIFKDADWFHFSGITPALGENCIKLVEKAVEAAKKHGVPISVDLNYRKQLWDVEQFEAVMPKLIENADVCIGWLSSIEEKQKEYKLADFAKDSFDEERFKELFSRMREKYNLKYVVTTLRENYSATHNGLAAIIYDGKELYKSKKYDFSIQDRVGAGDAFAAGLIYQLVLNKDHKEALDFAVAASVLKHTIDGDFNVVTENEVMELVKGNTSGSVQR
ncbi:sugar kinase [Clostridium sp. PL3]|uniref:Sugar kinase n=1 Tax=Clostridium thailandense TaxID=2794346 RepID=A0A949TNX0_9CLOT|nr:sugar kinase [Clostridium thailandense]MBV7273902.1 sugar kinase [Clostridium thailandense]